MKIAFCFLTYDIIIRYDIWNTFFENTDINKYVVFIHPKNIINFTPYKFNYNIVKNRITTTSKDNITIVKATLKLLEETYKNNNNNEDKITHFIFLSQSCIPLYNFNKLYELIKLFPYSVISSIDNNQKNRYIQLSDSIKKYINYNNFVKQQPNMILIREDVEKLIKYDLTNHFQYMICPDEHYFINILNNIFKTKIIKRQTHFCNYELQKTQGLEFYSIDNKFIDKIRNYGFLFMRKVNNMSVINIDYLYS